MSTFDKNRILSGHDHMRGLGVNPPRNDAVEASVYAAAQIAGAATKTFRLFAHTPPHAAKDSRIYRVKIYIGKDGAASEDWAASSGVTIDTLGVDTYAHFETTLTDGTKESHQAAAVAAVNVFNKTSVALNVGTLIGNTDKQLVIELGEVLQTVDGTNSVQAGDGVKVTVAITNSSGSAINLGICAVVEFKRREL
jgi:hypothetical protein